MLNSRPGRYFAKARNSITQSRGFSTQATDCCNARQCLWES